MKDQYIFGRGDLSGILEMATVLSSIDDTNDAFISFTTPKRLYGSIARFVEGEGGHIYIVGLALNRSNYFQLFKEIKKRPTVTSHFFDRHNLPQGVSTQDLPFNDISIDDTISTCENVYIKTMRQVSPVIPAMASINEGFNDTELVQEVKERYGDILYKNIDALKLALAVDEGDDNDSRFKRILVYTFGRGEPIQDAPGFISRYQEGARKFDEFRQIADRRKTTLDNVTYCFFHINEGYANILANYLALSTEKNVGVSVIETDRNIQKIKLVSTDPNLNIARVVRKVAGSVGGFGSGNALIANATMNTRSTLNFLYQLDVEVGRYR